jgi:hypothetical protein
MYFGFFLIISFFFFFFLLIKKRRRGALLGARQGLDSLVSLYSLHVGGQPCCGGHGAGQERALLSRSRERG